MTSKWFKITALFAFIATISFFQIDSAWADENNFNGIKGWLGIGIVFSICTILSAIKTIKLSNTEREQ